MSLFNVQVSVLVAGWFLMYSKTFFVIRFLRPMQEKSLAFLFLPDPVNFFNNLTSNFKKKQAAGF